MKEKVTGFDWFRNAPVFRSPRSRSRNHCRRKSKSHERGEAYISYSRLIDGKENGIWSREKRWRRTKRNRKYFHLNHRVKIPPVASSSGRSSLGLVWSSLVASILAALLGLPRGLCRCFSFLPHIDPLLQSSFAQIRELADRFFVQKARVDFSSCLPVLLIHVSIERLIGRSTKWSDRLPGKCYMLCRLSDRNPEAEGGRGILYKLQWVVIWPGRVGQQYR